MANYFLIPESGSHECVVARDIGPGNALIDLAAERLFGERYDKNGARASRGMIHDKLLSRIADPAFFGETGARSTGRETFGPAALEQILSAARECRTSDLDTLCTIVELTVFRIARAIRRIRRGRRGLSQVYVTGGGVKNIYLMKRLSALVTPVRVAAPEQFGISPTYVEAACFATLGFMCIHSIPSVDRSDDDRAPVLGRISQPPQTMSRRLK